MSEIAAQSIQAFIAKIRPDEPRDFHNEYSQAANLYIHIIKEFRAVGLDFAILNRGAAALTVSIDGRAPITIPAGTPFNLENTIFASVNIVSAVQFELVIGGVRIK